MLRLVGGRYVIDGMHEVLEEKRSKMRTLNKARQFHEEVLPNAVESQRNVDDIITGRVEYDEEKGRTIRLASPGMRIGDYLRKGDFVGKDTAKAKDNTKPVGRAQRSRFAGVGRRRG
jgi:hypothetical protein